MPPLKGQTPSSRSRGRYVLVAIVGVALFALCYHRLVLTAEGRTIDTSWAVEGAVSSADGARAAQLIVTLLGPAVLLPVTALLVLAEALRSRVRAVSLAVACSGLLASAWLLKQALPRPQTASEMAMPNSYPSGHVAVAAAFALAATAALHGRGRLVGIATGVVTFVAVAGAVVGLQWHRPSDAMGTALLGVTWWGVRGALATTLPGHPSIENLSGREEPSRTPVS